MQEFIYDKEAVNLVSVMENPYSVSAEPYLHASRTRNIIEMRNNVR